MLITTKTECEWWMFLLVPAHRGWPGYRAVKWVVVDVVHCWHTLLFLCMYACMFCSIFPVMFTEMMWNC